MVSRLIVVQAAALSSPSAWGQRRVLATGSAVPPVPCAAPHAGPPLVPTSLLDGLVRCAICGRGMFYSRMYFKICHPAVQGIMQGTEFLPLAALFFKK